MGRSPLALSPGRIFFIFFRDFPGFSGIFRDFPVAGPFYRETVSCRRPGGLPWQRQKQKAESRKQKAESGS
jgi:hypothetical protein